jgi:hypothetical protein
MTTRHDLFMLLDRAKHIVAEQVAPVETDFLAGVLRDHSAKLAALAAAPPPEADYPQAWPMLCQALQRVVGAMQNGERVRAERWAAVAFALIPLVRADYEALPSGVKR